MHKFGIIILEYIQEVSMLSKTAYLLRNFTADFDGHVNRFKSTQRPEVE